MCGVLSGGGSHLEQALDGLRFQNPAGFRHRTATGPLTQPQTNLVIGDNCCAGQSTPQGRARIALSAALATPRMVDPLLRNRRNDFNAQEANQFSGSATGFPFILASAPSLSSAPAAILPTTRE